MEAEKKKSIYVLSYLGRHGVSDDVPIFFLFPPSHLFLSSLADTLPPPLVISHTSWRLYTCSSVEKQPNFLALKTLALSLSRCLHTESFLPSSLKVDPRLRSLQRGAGWYPVPREVGKGRQSPCLEYLNTKLRPIVPPPATAFLMPPAFDATRRLGEVKAER
ncbi:hypothetical protein E2C01_068066 [Portunus trituberculatus]|uniref:Uncharacterized protein n=1 Tax=Portunus trituberculatus TaxID=210409 RepID=A0A5B7HVD8_PORTR|nr:hypothetical protein [Portunus trituberculatus]